MFDAGRGALETNYAKALEPFGVAFGQTSGAGARGYDALADATGANGPEGLARARALFTQTPGYSEGLNLTLDQNDRRAASRGMLASGNTDADTAKLATDYSNLKFGDYAARLQPYIANPGQAAGIAGGIAGVDMGLGNQINASFGKQGDMFYGAAAGVGNANANADLAKSTASGNFWNTALGIATAAAKAYAGGGK